MDETFVNAIRDLAHRGQEPVTAEIHGITYAANVPTPVYPPAPKAVVVQTLTGFAGIVTKEFGEWNGFAHVESEHSVRLVGKLDFEYRKRDVVVHADFTEAFNGYKFPFGQFLELETFIIMLQSRFVETDDLAQILKVVGNVRDESVKIHADDGITQTVTARSGVALVEEVDVPRLVKLSPYRTFHEVDQPVSRFILRMRSGDGMPTCALFEADGGAWKTEAMERIRVWLSENIKDLTVVA